MAAEGELDLEDLIAEEDMVIAITRSGYVKRLPVTTYREQRRGGIGVMGMDLKDEDYIEHLFVASTHDYLLFFTSVGKVYRLKVHELPLGSRQSKGRAIVNLLPFRQDEQVRAVDRDARLQGGRVPRLRDAERDRQEDELRGVQHPAQGRRDHRDQAARGRRARRTCATRTAARTSSSSRARARRSASTRARCARWAAPPPGVKGMGLRKGDEVISAGIADDELDMLVVTERATASARASPTTRVKGRGGLGVKTVQLTEARGQLAGALPVREGYQVMLISNGGTVIRMPVDEIKRLGRSTQGVIVMRLRGDEQVSSIALVAESDETGRSRARDRSSRRLLQIPARTSKFAP